MNGADRLKLPLYERPSVCGPCAVAGRACCLSRPGATSPEDWGAPDVYVMFERLTKAFETGLWALDRWDAEYDHDRQELRQDVCFPRPAWKRSNGAREYPFEAVDDEEDLISRMARRMQPAQTFPCVFLDTSGCTLLHDDRPLECRALEPSPPKCIEHAGGVEERAIEWWPYQGVIARMREIGGW